MSVPADWMMDWNSVDTTVPPSSTVHVHDETLRDGLQSPSVRQPTVDERLELLHLMDGLGVESVDLGMPVSNPATQDRVCRLAEEVRNSKLSMSPVCAARTVPADVRAVAEVSQRAGLEMWVMAFVGISPIRMYVEQWDLAAIVRDVAAAVSLARREGLRVCIVTEDTTRSVLDVALEVYLAALDEGGERICVCDTVGSATPWGSAALVRSLRNGLAERSHEDVGLDWHGHNDRGLGVANSLAAAAAGADRLHGTALGIGERAGNASMEQILVNLHDLGWRTGDLRALTEYCDLAARSCGLSPGPNQPLVGADAFRTVTGVHAAAIRKAFAVGDTCLGERVYGGVPASLVGREQLIDVGPGSGRANILHWLEKHGYSAEPALIEVLEKAVAQATRTFTDAELHALVTEADDRRPQPRPAVIP